jgi:glycosyltransferase involved in cell wall biosynthesis
MGAREHVSRRPLVSVVMNCYNGEKYVREAIESVLGQVYVNWELIFWDNQSADRSAEIFRSYRDPRLKYFRAPTHSFLYEARNRAIAKASGEFFAFLDVDDWWSADKLERQVPLFDNPEVGFACSNYWIVKEGERKRVLFSRRALPSGWVLNDILMSYPVGLLTLVVRRTAFEQLEIGCDPRFHVAGDMDLVVRLAQNWKMASIQTPLAFYRIHGQNEGQKQKARHVAEYATIVGELGRNAHVRNLPGYRQITAELRYMQGRLSLAENRFADTGRHLASLPWGKYKMKLLLLIIRDRLR